MSLDPLSAASTLIKSMSEHVSNAMSHKEDGNQMLQLARRTETLLRHLSQQDACTIGAQGTLEDITDALGSVHESIAECCGRSPLLSVLLASKDIRKLKEAAKKLGQALEAMPLDCLSATPEIFHSLSGLKADLDAVEFVEPTASTCPSAVLQTEVERVLSETEKSTSVENTPFEMNNALEKHSQSVEQKMRDLESLRSQLLFGGPEKEDEVKNCDLQQMIVEAMHEHSKPPYEKINDEFQRQPCCPLSRNLMKHPVILRGTGMTYDQGHAADWLACGLRTNPVRRQDLVSTGLIPNKAIKELANGFLQADERDTSSTKTKETQCLVAGLYEGRGRYVKKGGSIDHVFFVFLLEPDGNVQGYSLSEVPDLMSAEDDERLIFKGMWKHNQNELSFDDIHLSNKGSISYKPDSCQLAFDLTGKALPRDQTSSQEEIVFTICHVTRSPILHHCRIHPGILEMEGAIALEQGQELENRMVLIFEKDLSVRGWMTFEDDSHPANDRHTAHVLNGKWNNTGEVHLEIYFLESKTASLQSETEPSRFLAKFKLNGTLYEETDEAGAKSPVFQGEMKGMTMDSFDPCLSETVTTLNIPMGVRVHVNYTRFRAPSRCLSSNMQRQMKLLRCNSEPERHVPPGLVEIKFKHHLHLVETPLALGVFSQCDDEAKGVQSFYCGWMHVPWEASIWELQPVNKTQNEFYIKTHAHISSELCERCGYLTALPRNESETGHCEGCSNALSYVLGKSHACTWRLSYKGSKIVAEIKSHPDDSASDLAGSFLSMPNIKTDLRNPLSLYVPISKDPAETLGLEFTYHRRDEFE